MRFQQRERDILARVGLHAEESLRELSQRTGYQLHTVRYALDRLRQAKIIHKTWVIDVLRLGWVRYQVFFSTGVHSSMLKRSLVRFITNSPRVAFFAESGGDYDYELVFLGRDISEVLNFLGDCSKQFGDVFFSKATVIHQFVAVFPRKYLAQNRPPIEELVMGDKPGDYSITAFDHRLLCLLSQKPESTQRDMAQHLGCTAATVDSHLTQLKRNNIVRGALYAVDAGPLGGQNYILLVFAKGFDSSLSQALYHFAQKHPYCTNFRRCFGSWDYEIGVEVECYEDLVRLKDEIGERFGGKILTLKVLSRFRVHKYTLYPLAESDVSTAR